MHGNLEEKWETLPPPQRDKNQQPNSPEDWGWRRRRRLAVLPDMLSDARRAPADDAKPMPHDEGQEV